jgi:hypothetical protein
MYSTPNKSLKVRYKYIKYIHAFSTLQNLHMKNEDEMWRVV